jgi:hypothetical protein
VSAWMLSHVRADGKIKKIKKIKKIFFLSASNGRD